MDKIFLVAISLFKKTSYICSYFDIFVYIEFTNVIDLIVRQILFTNTFTILVSGAIMLKFYLLRKRTANCFIWEKIDLTCAMMVLIVKHYF